MGLFKKARNDDKGERDEATEATLAFPLSQSLEDRPTPVEEPEATPEVATADGPGTDEAETAPGSERLDLEGVLDPLEGDDQVTGDPDVDVDMTALTESLEEIDTESLIAEARDVSSNLRELLAK